MGASGASISAIASRRCLFHTSSNHLMARALFASDIGFLSKDRSLWSRLSYENWLRASITNARLRASITNAGCERRLRTVKLRSGQGCRGHRRRFWPRLDVILRCLDKVDQRVTFQVLENFVHGVHAHHPIALRLRFVEPLVAGSLVRKIEIAGMVTLNVRRFVSQKHRFHVDQVSVAAIRAIDVRVADPRYGAAFLTGL